MQHRVAIVGAVVAAIAVRHLATGSSTASRTANAAGLGSRTANAAPGERFLRGAHAIRDARTLGAALRTARAPVIDIAPTGHGFDVEGSDPDAADNGPPVAAPGEELDADGLTPDEHHDSEVAELEDRLPAGFGAIEGQLSDARGEPLGGATIVVTSPLLGARARTAVTDEHGFYVIRDLLAGDRYAATFYYLERTLEHGGITVWDSRATPVYEAFPPDTLPVPGRRFEDVLGAAAGTQSDPADGIGVSFSGTESLDNTYVVDGIDVDVATFE